MLIAIIGAQLAGFVFDFEQAPRQLTTAAPTQAQDRAPRAHQQPLPETVARVEPTSQPEDSVSSLSGNRAYSNESDPNSKTMTDSGASSRASGNLRATLKALRLDGVTVERIDEDAGRFTIVGFAEDNVRVAAYMRLLSDEVGKPVLNLVQKGQRLEKTVSEFSIAMQK